MYCCTEPVNGCRICIVGSASGAANSRCCCSAGRESSRVREHRGGSSAHTAILTPCSRASFGSANQSRCRPPTRELILRKVARYEGKDRGPLHSVSCTN